MDAPDSATRPVAEDPRLTARRLDAETAGWCVWHGSKTGLFWAVTISGPPVIVQGGTAGELVQCMRWFSAASKAHPSDVKTWTR